MLGQHRHASETLFKLRFAGGPMMAPLYTPYTRDATFLFTSQIRNNLTRRVREWIVVS